MKTTQKKLVIFFVIVCVIIASFALHRLLQDSSSLKNRREGALQKIITLWNANDYELVIAESKKYLVDYPEDSYVRIIQAISLLNSAELGVDNVYKKDIESIWHTVYEIRRALVINPSVAYKDEALYVLGKAYYLLGGAQIPKAIEYLEGAVKNKVVSADLYEFLVAAYKSDNRYDDAIALIGKMLKKSKGNETIPSGISLRLTLVDLLLDTEDATAAELEIQRALSYSGISAQEKAAFMIRSARILLMHKDVGKAMQVLSAIIKKDANSFEALYYMGVAHDMKGESGKARYYWRRVLAINPYWDKILEKLNTTQ